jgi:predicted chitinase
MARIGHDGDAISEHVQRLRNQIDPRGYRTRGLNRVAQAGIRWRAPTRHRRRLTGRAAYELYQALLGDRNIQRVMGAGRRC